MQIDLANLLPDLPGNLSGISPNRYNTPSGCSPSDLRSTWHLNRTGHTFAQAAETLAAIKEKAGNYALSLWNSDQLNQILSGKVDVGRHFVSLIKLMITSLQEIFQTRITKTPEAKSNTSMPL